MCGGGAGGVSRGVQDGDAGVASAPSSSAFVGVICFHE